MKTVLGANGEIGIPAQIREADHLHAGDSFEVERLMPGQYVVTKEPAHRPRFTTATGSDGLPVIRAENGIITSQRVKELESLTP
jgi:bifunctional DNA-binding transcriptional regulator/antitoxin component of YhaV-PrlF toxin-antitoxin module